MRLFHPFEHVGGGSEGRVGGQGVEELVRSGDTQGSEGGFGVLEEQLGKEVVGGMLEFWADDWVID